MAVEYRTATDGRPARVAAMWTEEKLMILECYLAAFADACKKAEEAGGWYALDAFAGGGLNWSEAREKEIPGSPLIALEAEAPRATRVLLCEQDDRTRRALAARCTPYGERAMTFDGDVNASIAGMLAEVPRRAPAFAFLDPEGADIEWATVREIARHKDSSYTKVEQLILFPTDMGFMRLLDHAQKNQAGAQRVGRIFHTEEWRDIWDARAAGKITADEARSEYVQLYAEGLRGLGYATVLDRRVPARGRRQYFLLFATDHPAGEKIMDHCFNQVRARSYEELAQGQLFRTPEPPRPTRLQ